MVYCVAAEIGYALCETIAHAYYAQLGYRVLLEEFCYERCCVAESEEEAGWSEVFLGHGEGEVENEDHVADDASL